VEEDTVKKAISINIKKLRKSAGLKQKELAKKIGVSESSISSYEKATNLFPLEKLPLVIEALNCSITDIFEPLFNKREEDKEISEMMNKIRHLLSMPEYKRAIKVMLDSMGPPPQLEKKRARGSPDLG